MPRRGLSTPGAVVATVIILVVTALTFVYVRPPGTNSPTITTTVNPNHLVTVSGSSTVVITTTQFETVKVFITVESSFGHDVLVGVLVTAAPSPFLVGSNSSVTNNQGQVTFTFNLDQPIQESFTSSDSGHNPGSVSMNLGPGSGDVSTVIYEQCKSFNAVC